VINEFILKQQIVQIVQISHRVEPIENVKAALLDALKNSKGTLSFDSLVLSAIESRKKIVIGIDDNTRKNEHTKILLAYLVEYIIASGVDEEKLILLIASGSHRAPTESEIATKILGKKLYKQHKDKIIIHRSDENCTKIDQKTKSGTPIWINSVALDAGLIISLVDSEYHYFAGISGNFKQIIPGIAGTETIRHNHVKMFDEKHGFNPECRLGNVENNPIMKEMKEITKIVMEKVPIFAIDAIVYRGKIVHLNAGDMFELQKLAIELIRPIREFIIDEPADVVVVEFGALGLNLYQSGKGFHAAANAVKEDGIIIGVGPCPDGVGNQPYEDIMCETVGKSFALGRECVLDEYCNVDKFLIGYQKIIDLFNILLKVGKGNLRMISEMDSELLKNVFRIERIANAETAQEVLRRFFTKLYQTNPNARILVLKDPDILVKVRVA
jgi:nickel-dependent lactate racemase